MVDQLNPRYKYWAS